MNGADVVVGAALLCIGCSRPLVTEMVEGARRTPLPSLRQESAIGSTDGRGDRARMLTAVVRLLHVGRPVCTGTLVKTTECGFDQLKKGGRVGVVTAAHCLYEVTPEGAFRGRWDISIEGIPNDALGEPEVVFEDFVTCAYTNSYQSCITKGAADLAFIQVHSAALAGRVQWDNCYSNPTARAGPHVGHRLAVITFAAPDAPTRPESLVVGKFLVDKETTDEGGITTALGERGQHVNYSDSGGPGIEEAEYEALDVRAPTLQFVVSGIAYHDPFDPYGTAARAIFASACDIDRCE
jgi:hypothetical protein